LLDSKARAVPPFFDRTAPSPVFALNDFSPSNIGTDLRTLPKDKLARYPFSSFTSFSPPFPPPMMAKRLFVFFPPTCTRFTFLRIFFQLFLKTLDSAEGDARAGVERLFFRFLLSRRSIPPPPVFSLFFSLAPPKALVFHLAFSVLSLPCQYKSLLFFWRFFHLAIIDEGGVLSGFLLYLARHRRR